MGLPLFSRQLLRFSQIVNTVRKMSRGALIVFEGCDRSGKSTQCKKIVDALNEEGAPAQMLRFPDRETAIGKVISGYLEKKVELEDHAVHLLFTANRWETVPKMKELLAAGKTLIVDRYSFSGVAFTAAKPGLNLKWCREPEIGLPRPDAVIFMKLSPEVAASRSNFGGERYEQTDFQTQVAANYEMLQDADWKVVNANKSIDELHVEVKALVKQIIEEAKAKELGQLWVSEESADAPPCKRPCVIDSASCGICVNGENSATTAHTDNDGTCER